MPFSTCPDCPSPGACSSAGKCLNPKEERKNTTMSGQPRLEDSYGLRELLDDYGPMSIITRMLQGHDDEIPSMPSGLGGLGFDAMGQDRDGNSSGRIKALKEAEQQRFKEIRENRTISDAIMQSGDDGLGKIKDADDIISHYKAMEGGDDSLTYSQSGEMVMPVRVQQNFPELAMAVQMAMAQSGLNPDQYVVGSDQGNYNSATGAQQFNDPWYVELWNNVTEGASNLYDNAAKDIGKGWDDFVDDPLGNDLVQAGLAGAGSYGAAKLAGADTDQALQAALGGAAGYGLSGLGEENPLTTSEKLLSGAVGAYGAYNAYEPPRPEPTYTPSNPVPTDYGQILDSQNVPYGASNQQANLSMTLPSSTPPAYSGMQKPAGVTYLEEVDDRDGGSSYQEVGPQYSPTFGRSISAQSRRADVSGFGNKVLYM